MNKLKKITPFLLVGMFLALPFVVFGQVIDPLDVAPTEGGLTGDDVAEIIANVANFVITIGLIIAVITVVVAGILWATAGGDEAKVKTAKQWLKNGLIAALIIFGAGVLIDTMKNIVARQFV